MSERQMYVVYVATNEKIEMVGSCILIVNMALSAVTD